ncbi:MAG TPA: hypothetical protein VN908_03750 [Gemmatimonadales bacterium]|nr:hypothetical protein [Gemmatimonadales bacterium]
MHATLPYTIAVGFGMILVTSASAQNPNPPGVNPQHYQCYNVADPRPATPRTVVLQDQFGRTETATGKPVLVCNPVSKNREQVRDTVTHLVCYEIRARRVPRHQVQVVNQFGIDTLPVDAARVLCLPSTKRIVR